MIKTIRVIVSHQKFGGKNRQCDYYKASHIFMRGSRNSDFKNFRFSNQTKTQSLFVIRIKFIRTRQLAHHCNACFVKIKIKGLPF